MSDTWRLLITPPAPGAWNMAVDEAILDDIGFGNSQPTLRLYAWQPPCLSLGYAQPFADVDMERLTKHGWDIVRRLTGGRAILHSDELTYSVIASTNEPRVAGSILESYNRLAAALLDAVSSLGLNVEMNKSGSANQGTTNPVCFEVPSAYEITVGGKKLIGSAQARRKAGVLQHGSLPLTGSLARITEALVFTDKPSRQDAADRLLARATTVESALGCQVTWDTAARAFVHAFTTNLRLTLEESALSHREQIQAEKLVRERYDHHDWLRRV